MLLSFSEEQGLTQVVASNILRSRGSPWMVPSRRIREWQLAMAAQSGPHGKALPEAKLWISWKLKEKRKGASVLSLHPKMELLKVNIYLKINLAWFTLVPIL